MVESWQLYSVLVGLILAIAEIGGRLTPIGGPLTWLLTWLWRKGNIMWLKHKRSWPIEIRLTKDSLPTAFHKSLGASIDPRPHVYYLYVDCSVTLRIHDRKSGARIRNAELELTNNNHQVWRGRETTGLDVQPMVGRRICDMANDVYDITLGIPIDAYLVDWYNRGCVTSIYSKIRLTVGEAICEADLGIVIKRQS